MTAVELVPGGFECLTGDHPWIPGAVFIAHPGLQDYLIEVAIPDFIRTTETKTEETR